MAHRLRPVGLDFIESAPLRLVYAAGVAADAEAVYGALAEDLEAMPTWFSAVTQARHTEGGRSVRLKGGVRMDESILAAEPSIRYAYRVDETNAPGLRALLEEWRLTTTESGTRVQWTFAADGPAPLLAGMRLGRAGMGRAFRQAVQKLDERLATAPA
ncbi:SRPBCC family protein [Streptomyces sp. NBC_01387]|uniref:SRPBCC family protein n=1 Tax=unclassified Streptomyces TaxID=2593676 RepID=UPI002024102F|nr:MULTISPECIES: SRPBCC family protein [unclassified Streptomyces]MCX4552619.1 SRPBCC family protein [Streptomyces sp. NBC_01500]WSC23962.1 SRPBCC family protein [Streptomyces sp. NBC_01766]WSV57845.1 SRPBCC family protein [Streptomyces sp. NBC_01014]